MSRIILENVTARFGKVVAVDNVSLEIPDGTFFGLLGPSGCGKTTTMRLIAGLETPVSGRIYIGDRLVSDAEKGIFVPPSQRQLGMVFQNYALWPHMTVKENIIFGLKVRKVKEAECNRKYREITERLQVAEFGERYPNELSGGQQQRIALARELIAGSTVLLMDEPLSNLDAKLRVDMRVELKQLHQDTGGTIMYVTHDQIEALTLSSLMSVMKDGVIQQLEPPHTVFTRPANLFVASFMASAPINTFEVSRKADRLVGERIDIPIPPSLDVEEGRAMYLVARPEELTITHAKKSEWAIQGEITSLLPMGYSQLVRLQINEEVHLIAEHDQRNGTLAEGERVWAHFSEETLHLFDKESELRIDL